MQFGAQQRITYAGMAELADAHGSGPCGSNTMRVQVSFPALFKIRTGISPLSLFPALFILKKVIYPLINIKEDRDYNGGCDARKQPPLGPRVLHKPENKG